MPDTTITYPTGPGGMSAKWRDYAFLLRQVIDDLGATMGECLPGEPDWCGEDYANHCMSYLAALQARAEFGLRHLHHGDPASKRVAENLLTHWREQFAEEDHEEDRGSH